MIDSKKNGRSGFTLAEVMLVTLIIAALASVSFIAVRNYQRSIEQLEYDSIAKEIFIAAQNHLSMAESQGYLDSSYFGSQEGLTEKEKEQGMYYFVVGSAQDSVADPYSALSLMLPSVSIDDTVRLGGSYIVKYQKSPAQVLAVFYSDRSDARFGYSFTKDKYGIFFPDYTDTDSSKRLARRSYTEGGKKYVIGYYGGVEPLNMSASASIDTPSVQVFNSVNSDTLRVTVSVPAYEDPTGICLVITGATSGRSRMIELNPKTLVPTAAGYERILDDVTAQDMHFKKLFCSGSGSVYNAPVAVPGETLDIGDLIPGEDILIRALAYNDSGSASSEQLRTNSLFASLSGDGTTVEMSGMRHLLNLGENVSGFLTGGTAGAVLNIENANLISDLSWDGFASAVGSAPSELSIYDSGNTKGESGRFTPIQPSGAIAFDGGDHSISGLDISSAGNAGLFASLYTNSSVHDLRLEDIRVSGTNAGTLAGTANGCLVNNILAVNSGASAAVSVSGTESGGGLIGRMSGGVVTKSAAALVVNSAAGNAGGLIGTVSGPAAIYSSYSGGHTIDGGYSGVNYNVTAAAAAGGLIGDAGDAAVINYCYSTCSAKGAAAGGLFGVSAGTGLSVSNSYATGRVSGTTAGAVFGTFTGTAVNCSYYEIINERPAGNAGYRYLGPVGGKTVYGGISALDADAVSYNAFVGDDADWQNCSAYDGELGKYYQGKYNLKTVRQLGGTAAGTDFVTVHYGDWPVPEIFMINSRS